jgi:hypothetical protein
MVKKIGKAPKDIPCSSKKTFSSTKTLVSVSCESAWSQNNKAMNKLEGV